MAFSSGWEYIDNTTRQVAEHFDWIHGSSIDKSFLKIAQRLNAQRPRKKRELLIVHDAKGLHSGEYA